MRAFGPCCLVFAGVAWSLAPAGVAQTSDPMGAYRQTATYCGSETPQRDAPAIPWIGCFVLDAGHRARGTFATHELAVGVDEAGHESFAVDGEPLVTGSGTRMSPSGTTSLFARPSGSGYRLCRDPAGSDCPAIVSVFSRDTDRSVLFTVSECLPWTGYHACVMTQANWDAENAHHPVDGNTGPGATR